MDTQSIRVENIRQNPPSAARRIHLRQKEGLELSWITFTQDNPTLVHFAPQKDAALGAYQLVLESFDADEMSKTTLLTDTIMIRVEAADLTK